MTLALDTNVLIRLLTRDDEQQFAAAINLLSRAIEAGSSVIIFHSVLLETEWVLRSRYKLKPLEIQQAFTAMLETQGLTIQQPAVVEEALRLWIDWPKSDFADCLHVATALQNSILLATFDQAAAHLPGALLVRAG